MARFRPPWWATLGTLALGALFLAAGTWQLQRAAEKRALFAAFDAGTASGAVPAPGAGAGLEGLRYRAIEATGRYDGDHQVLLDARTRDGEAGYEVLTPLRTGSGAVLVNRGWVPAGPDRRRLPAVGVGPEERRVTGLLDRLPRPALASAAEAGRDWPRRMLFPTAAEIGQALGYPVPDYQLLLAPGERDGYRRDWRPAVMSAEQHVAYAVQWFAMAAALVIIYVALNLRRSRESTADD